ncbi:MAG TPA: 5-formyltetrahydrofolate cyclo-ligase [Candidatus Hydrogenedentes bacterium]|nr:5-formyltetrahydrofolate cyclo-ligase [Candidatus Hydrogenedentota bacterium]HPG66624.1 5-formyltetrahydrofolate cyclo-ligase [Candidatus Hydrogenedentota bacterium]
MDEKDTLRKAYLARRRALSDSESAEASRGMVTRLQALDAYRTASTVLCYVSSKDNEVDTHDLIRAMLAEGKTVLVPVARPSGVLAWSRIASLDDLAPGRFGILEPRPECLRPSVPPVDALVIVPGIAFTPEGDRLGYGGGYYDRFLDGHPGPSIGLAFACQIAEQLPLSAHDRPVDALIVGR